MRRACSGWASKRKLVDVKRTGCPSCYQPLILQIMRSEDSTTMIKIKSDSMLPTHVPVVVVDHLQCRSALLLSPASRHLAYLRLYLENALVCTYVFPASRTIFHRAGSDAEKSAPKVVSMARLVLRATYTQPVCVRHALFFPHRSMIY